MLRGKVVKLIEQEFISRGTAYRLRVRQRSSILSEFQSWLALIETHQVCLACLRNSSPEHKFPCEHIFCETCCTELGDWSEEDPHLYQFRKCPICAISCDVRVRVKPATAGVRVLSLDGGGIRARVPIQFLRVLEQMIGIDMPVQEHFEFGYGTSSGTVVPLILCSSYSLVVFRVHGGVGPLRTGDESGRGRQALHKACDACFSRP